LQLKTLLPRAVNLSLSTEVTHSSCLRGDANLSAEKGEMCTRILLCQLSYGHVNLWQKRWWYNARNCWSNIHQKMSAA